MPNLSFYFTGPLEGGHHRYSDTSEMDQSFLRKNLVQKFKTPELINSHFDKIANHLAPFYQRGKEKIKTDISGIIVPICHGDISDYFHIAISIEGDFLNDLEAIWKSNGIYEEHPEDIFILKKRADLTYSFMDKILDIPVFEAHKFLPGYREIPFPKGKENMSSQERISYVESAFNSWIKENFEK